MTSFIAALSVPAAAVALGVSAPAAAQSQCGDSYTIESGDTLYSIAQRCRTSLDAIVRANDEISDPSAIRVGWTIRIPNGADSASNRQPASRPADQTYTVQRGDTLYAIAQRLGVTVSDLLAENTGIDPRALFTGQPIRIPGDGNRGDDGAMQVTGVITREGVECPSLRADNGQLYTLAGDTDPYGPGDRVRVRGTEPDMSTCQQGTTIRVQDIDRIS